MSNPQRTQDGTGILNELDFNGRVIIEAYSPSALFLTVPSDGQPGFARGATFYKLDGSAGAQVYTNEGTETSCAFKSADALDGILATVAELNRNNQTSARIVSATGTLTVTQALHEGRIILLNAAGGFSSTLPAATGSGNRFTFCVGTVSVAGYVINTADQLGADTDIFAGSIFIGIDGAATGKDFKTASTSNRITINGSTTGGVTIGDTIYIQDIAAGVYAVEGSIIGSGGIATPFSHV